MTPFILYLIKVNFALVVLYTFYKLMFTKDTFFGLRRFMLILIYITSFVYPLFSIPGWMTMNHTGQVINDFYEKVLPEIEITYNAGVGISVNPGMSLYSWIAVSLMIVYVIGISILLIRTVLEIYKTCYDLHQSDKTIIDGTCVCIAKEKQEPYSFFKWICLYPAIHTNKEIKEILIHEQTHVRELHSADILLAQLAIIFCWFNPFAWLIRSEMRVNHEYLADRKVIQNGYDKKTYQYHLLGLKHTQLAAANLYNNFSVLPLKNRIKMLNRKRTRNIMKSKYLMFIPITALLILFSNCANMESEDKATKNEEVEVKAIPEVVKNDTLTATANDAFDVVEEMPEFPGGMEALMTFLSRNIKYPSDAQNKGVQGRVVIQFVVNTDGKIEDAHVVRSVQSELDKEALRVINSMPNWKPGKQKGEVVRVKYTVPIAFRLK